MQAPDIAAAGLTALLAAIGIHHVAATEARERQREIGTLLATGWSPRTIARLLLTQAGLIALLGGLLGVGAALAAAHWILQADIATTLGACALALSLTVVLSIVTTAPITVRAARAAPISMLRDD